MSLKEYAERIFLSIQGIPDLYRPFIQNSDTQFEIIAKYLKGDLIEETSQKPLEPKVNLLINEIESNLIQNLPEDLPYVKKWYWPNWKEYALCISHDVDKISETKKHIWKIRKRFSKVTLLKAMLGLSNPYNNFKLYAKIEKKIGVRSSFYFLTDEYDFKKINCALEELKKNKSELSLHGGFGTHTNPIQLQNEKQKIEELLGVKTYGIRQHFLKFEFPTTWEVQSATNFLYDTTIGFNDKIGFKNSICFPFFVIDHKLNILPIIEIPLIIMDAAIWSGLKLTEETAPIKILEVREIIKKYHGLLSLLWHQCTLKMQGGRLYPDILKVLIEASTYVASSVEIAQWWRARDAFEIKISKLSNELSIHFTNPQKIQNLGIIIQMKNTEIIFKSSNLELKEQKPPIYKLTFLSGDSGEIKLKRN